ncbi:MAG: DUF559 domain-containing protein [Patescibacteria group bacterium]|nr:DUF559 domain-containing protein [Patescibacteria group bacterium]
MSNIKSTPQETKLFNSLLEKGVDAKLQHWDGHKHIDIAILEVKIYIEVDGSHHLTIVQQIEKDFIRDSYSKESGFDTIHIPNSEIDHNLERIANAIAKVVKFRKEKFLKPSLLLKKSKTKITQTS